MTEVTHSVAAHYSEAVCEAVDGLIWSALAVAGHRLRQTPAVPRPARAAARELAASAVHLRHPVADYPLVDAWRLLDGAWERVPEVAGRYGIDAGKLAVALNEYCQTLLVHGHPHDYDTVRRLLLQRGIMQDMR